MLKDARLHAFTDLAAGPECAAWSAPGFPINFEEGPAAIPSDGPLDAEKRDELVQTLTEIGGNMKASSHYLSLARDLDVMEAKLPDEV